MDEEGAFQQTATMRPSSSQTMPKTRSVSVATISCSQPLRLCPMSPPE
jgi:hypothetical protein